MHYCGFATLSIALAPRLSTSVAKPQVQVVTHLCYSDFQDIMQAVDDMDGETVHSLLSQRGGGVVREGCVVDRLVEGGERREGQWECQGGMYPL